jgi:hypothetical protein
MTDCGRHCLPLWMRRGRAEPAGAEAAAFGDPLQTLKRVSPLTFKDVSGDMLPER